MASFDIQFISEYEKSQLGLESNYLIELLEQYISNRDDISETEKHKICIDLKTLSSVPVGEWPLKVQLLKDECENSLAISSVNYPFYGADFTPPQRPLTETEQNISDYEPKFMFLPRKFSRDYHEKKKVYISGPPGGFQIPDPLAFHYTVEMLIDNEEACIAIIDSETMELGKIAANDVISGDKFLSQASKWLSNEIKKALVQHRKWHQNTVTSIGCPIMPQQWAINKAIKARVENNIPEELYTNYEPQFDELYDSFSVINPDYWGCIISKIIEEME